MFLVGLLAISFTPIVRAADSPTSSASSSQQITEPADAAVVTLQGTVDSYSRDALFRRFEQARATGAKVIILDIDTYGGLVLSGTEISRFLKRQDDLHVVAFVKDKAISAGAMIAVACDEIVMGPSAVLGDCAPIVFKYDGSIDAMPAAERGKAESPVVAEFEDSAQRNHYDPLLLTSMVSVGRIVHYVQDEAGNKKFVDEKEFAELTKEGKWKPVAGVRNPVDDANSLLTVHTSEAVNLGLAKAKAASPQALAADRGWRIVGDFSPTWGDQIVELLSHPVSRLILLITFFMCLNIALSAPGHGAPEALSLLSLGLLLGVPLLTGYAQWWEILLIFAGMALVAFEIFVFPGHFLSIVLGALMMIAGLVLTFVGNAGTTPGAWKMPATWDGVRNGLLVVAGGMAVTIALSIWLRKYLPRMPYFGRLVLMTTSGGPGAVQLPATDAIFLPSVGMIGTAMSDLRPGGTVDFDGQVVPVQSDAGYVRAGNRVIVRDVEGQKVIVRPA